MKKLTFPKAVGDVLIGAGFTKTKAREWSREADGYLDKIDLQVSSSFDQITVNIYILDTRVRSIIERACRSNPFLGRISPVYQRLPSLMTGYDRWWSHSDPEGPAAVAEAVRDHALPFLDRMHSPEAMIAFLEARGSIKWRAPVERMNVAVILSYLGRTDEALAALSDPPRRINGPWLRDVEDLRRWISGQDRK